MMSSSMGSNYGRCCERDSWMVQTNFGDVMITSFQFRHWKNTLCILWVDPCGCSGNWPIRRQCLNNEYPK